MCPRKRITDDDRRKWQDPEAILADIDLKAGDTFADIGCGNGYFALPAARIVGPTGKVYGIDKNPAVIEELKQLAAKEGLENIELTVGKAESVVLCNHCADTVFFGMDLHDFENPARVLHNAHKMISPEGQIVDLDWKKMKMDFGPPFEIRFSEEKAIALLEKAGFRVRHIKSAGLYHYMIIAGLVSSNRPRQPNY